MQHITSLKASDGICTFETPLSSLAGFFITTVSYLKNKNLVAILFQRSDPIHGGKLMKIALELNLGKTGDVEL